MRPSSAELQARLKAALPDAAIFVDDESEAHRGHAGAQGGAGHYAVVITSAAFQGLSRLARHRLVYDALRDWLPHRVHAVRITAHTPDNPPPP